MTVSTKHLVDAVNTNILNSSAKVEDVIASVKTFDELNDKVFSVPNLASLPSAANNIGRLVWVTDIADYRYSDGIAWLRDFNSSIHYRNSVWAWGRANYGQLGDNTGINKSSPVLAVGEFTDWCQVSANSTHSLGVRSNGTLWSWGANNIGQLGNNTTVSRSSPVSVLGGVTDWCQVSAGGSHTAATRTNGTLWAWGNNNYGQLGNNANIDRSSPVSVVGGFTDWCQVSAGLLHSIAIRTNGTVWSWGSNQYGRLGNNTIVSSSSPVSVVGGFTDWCQVSAGNAHTAAVRTNGTIWTWGRNLQGQLGDVTTGHKSSPVSVVGGFTDWCQVSAGSSHTAAIRTNGTIWAWGSNSYGVLGDSTTVAKSSPVSVVGGFTDWCQVSVNSSHSAAVRTNGTIWTWGSGSYGRLGDNTIIVKSSPVSVVGGFTDWCQVSAGYRHTLAIRKQQVGF